VNILVLSELVYFQDSSFLFMGRLLEGFGVGVISYTVCNSFVFPLIRNNLHCTELVTFSCPTIFQPLKIIVL